MEGNMDPCTVGVLAGVLMGFALASGIPVRRIVSTAINGGPKPEKIDAVLALLEEAHRRQGHGLKFPELEELEEKDGAA